MNGDRQLELIEHRLRQEADRLLRRHGADLPTPTLLAEHGRRVRIRRATRAVASAVGVVVIVGLAAVAVRSWPEAPVAGRDSGAPVEGSPVEIPSDRNGQAPGVDPSNASPNGALAAKQIPEAVPQLKAGIGHPVAVPVVITVAEGEQRRVIATGVYVPEHVVNVNLLDLPPAEQHAVRQVLGISESQLPQGPI